MSSHSSHAGIAAGRCCTLGRLWGKVFDKKAFPLFGNVLLPCEAGNHTGRIGPYRLGHIQKFDHIEPPFPAFVLGNVRLRLVQPVGHVLLSQPRRTTFLPEQAQKLLVPGCVDRLVHKGPLVRKTSDPIIPFKDYPKIGYCGLDSRCQEGNQ